MKYKNYLERIKCYSPRTVEIYVKYAGMLEKENNNYEKLLQQTNNHSINTKRLMFSAIISYYKFLKDERWKEIKLPKREVLVKEYVTYDQYKEFLIGLNNNTKMGFQMRIIIRLLFETGIRSQELLTIRKEHVVNNSIKIFGKGKKHRIVKISPWLEEELNQYLKNCSQRNLFNFKYKNLYKRVSSLDKDKKITPHMFRRGYAKYCFEKGVSIYDISLSMGHSSIETTATYIKRNSNDVNIFSIFQ